MKNLNVKLPLLPVHIFILPDGLSRIKIVEQRYLKIVSLATKSDGFVIQNNKTQWGSWVQIVNFNQNEDGILEIDVKCKCLVHLLNLPLKDANKIALVEVKKFEHWSEVNSAQINFSDENDLSESLEKALSMNETLIELYPTIKSNNIYWVVARWLELLPLNNNVKNSFVSPFNFKEAKKFVLSIVSN